MPRLAGRTAFIPSGLLPTGEGPQVGSGPVRAAAGQSRMLAGAAAPFPFQGVVARPRPGRQLTAGTPLLHQGGHPIPQEAECRQHSENGHEKERHPPGMMGIGAGAVWIEEGAEPYGGGRDDQADARLGGRPGQRPTAGRSGPAHRPGRGRFGRFGRFGRDVRGERGQVGVGPTNTTHFLRSLTAGRVTVEAVPLSQGRTQQLWRVDITDESGSSPTARSGCRTSRARQPPRLAAAPCGSGYRDQLGIRSERLRLSAAGRARSLNPERLAGAAPRSASRPKEPAGAGRC
jgi:hypothetical protein